MIKKKHRIISECARSTSGFPFKLDTKIATKEREKKSTYKITVSVKLVYNRVPKDSFSPPVKKGFHLNR